MIPEAARQELLDAVGPRGLLDRDDDLRLYEFDGGVDKARPDVVVFPRSTEEVSAIARIAHRHKVPLVGRGAGTGLSGGAIPRHGGIIVGFSRMNRILEIDLENERAVVEPGVVNLDLTNTVAPMGYFYRAGPFEPEGLHHRRQCRGERRRPPYAHLRSHYQPCPRTRRSCCRTAVSFTPAPAIADSPATT
jgi:hypothetical protein